MIISDDTSHEVPSISRYTLLGDVLIMNLPECGFEIVPFSGLLKNTIFNLPLIVQRPFDPYLGHGALFALSPDSHTRQLARGNQDTELTDQTPLSHDIILHEG